MTLDLDAPAFREGLEKLRRISVATEAAKARGGIGGALQRVGLGLAGAVSFARLYLLRTQPNALPADARMVPSW